MSFYKSLIINCLITYLILLQIQLYDGGINEARLPLRSGGGYRFSGARQMDILLLILPINNLNAGQIPL